VRLRSIKHSIALLPSLDFFYSVPLLLVAALILNLKKQHMPISNREINYPCKSLLIGAAHYSVNISIMQACYLMRVS